MKFLRIFGDANAREIKRLAKIVESIDANESKVKSYSGEELKTKSLNLRESIQSGRITLEEALAEAFAFVREASTRTLGQRHFGVQLMAGIVLHEGKIAEMRTGEGKTLAATCPIYLNALTGKGSHVVTVNDYLARRDTVWMGQIYNALGLSVGCVAQAGAYIYDPEFRLDKEDEARQDLERRRDIEGSFRVYEEFLRPASKKEAYEADITYGTNTEFGFDYLRDNLVYDWKDMVQRPCYFAIVDEVDSILIDEARTPLIISMPDEDAARLYKEFTRFIPRLKKDVDFTIDEKMRSVLLTDEGMTRVEGFLGRKIYEENNLVLIHHVEEALKAHFLFERDRDYVVKNGEVIIVDEFTGRLMHGRRYVGGLHQALEAKESVSVKQESRTIATVTYQNFFRMYPKLAGMTGTAATSAEEFFKVYRLEVVIIPTNKPMIRHDLPDLVLRTEQGKFKALIRDIRARHETGQPILIGTVSIQKNELISKLLSMEGVKYEILNAKQHEREGQIIAQAGRLGAVTVATNIAGRGVDIVLGGNPPVSDDAKKVKELGGVHVLGTERHEARRIDNQLRGRTGRQGDQGSSQFYVSLEDDLMRIFGSKRVEALMETLGIPEDEPIQNKLVSRALEAAQSKIEGFNFDIRKHVLEYDDVLAKQRDVVYRLRRQILSGNPDELRVRIGEIIDNSSRRLVEAHISARTQDEWDIDGVQEFLRIVIPPAKVHAMQEELKNRAKEGEDALREYTKKLMEDAFSEREKNGGEDFLKAVRGVMLRVVDILWTDHLETMENLRDSVRLRAYGQRDPLIEYKKEGHRLYQVLLANFDFYVVQWILRVPR